MFLLVLRKWKQFVYKRRALALPALNIPFSNPSFCCPNTEHGPTSRLPRDLVLPCTTSPPNHHQDSRTLSLSPPYFLSFYSVEIKKNKPMFPAITILQHMTSDTTYMTVVSPHTTYTVQQLGLILTLSTWALSPRLPMKDASHLLSYPVHHMCGLQHSDRKTILGWQLWLTPRDTVQQAPCDCLWSQQKCFSVRRMSFFILEDLGAPLCAWVRHCVYSHWDSSLWMFKGNGALLGDVLHLP